MPAPLIDARRAPGDYAGLQVLGDTCFGDRNDPIQQHRHSVAGRGSKKANARGNVGRSERGKALERVLRALPDPIKRRRDHLSFMPKPVIVYARAAPDNLPSRQPKGRCDEGSCGCRVADPHVADDQQIGARGDLILRDRLAGPYRLLAVGCRQGIGLVDRLGGAEVVRRNLSG